MAILRASASVLQNKGFKKYCFFIKILGRSNYLQQVMKKSVIYKNLRKSLFFKDFENTLQVVEILRRIGRKEKSALK